MKCYTPRYRRAEILPYHEWGDRHDRKGVATAERPARTIHQFAQWPLPELEAFMGRVEAWHDPLARLRGLLQIALSATVTRWAGAALPAERLCAEIEAIGERTGALQARARIQAGPDGATLGTQNWTGVSPAPGAIHVEVARSGWHIVRLTAAQLPEPGTTPFAMTISYLSTQTFGGD